jgi:hypothetical protein
MNYGLQRFNAMIGQFNRRRWLVFHTIDVTCVSSGSPVYTLGIGQQFDTPIVDKLENGCFFRQYLGGAIPSGSDFNNDFSNDFGPPGSSTAIPSGSDFNNDFSNDFGPPGSSTGAATFIDYPLTLIESREAYNRIALKNLASWPTFVFFDYANVPTLPIGTLPTDPQTQYPTGYVYINPVPNAGQFEIHLNVKAPLLNLANLSTVLATPPEYEEAFEYNLALRFAAKYQIEASKEVIGLAQAALATIRSANNRVPLLDLPIALTGNGSRYNVYSDRSY